MGSRALAEQLVGLTVGGFDNLARRLKHNVTSDLRHHLDDDEGRFLRLEEHVTIAAMQPLSEAIADVMVRTMQELSDWDLQKTIDFLQTDVGRRYVSANIKMWDNDEELRGLVANYVKEMLATC